MDAVMLALQWQDRARQAEREYEIYYVVPDSLLDTYDPLGIIQYQVEPWAFDVGDAYGQAVTEDVILGPRTLGCHEVIDAGGGSSSKVKRRVMMRATAIIGRRTT